MKLWFWSTTIGTPFATGQVEALWTTGNHCRDDNMIWRRTATSDDAHRLREKREGRSWKGRHPLGTGVGSAVGAAIVLAAAGALGAGTVAFATSVAVGMVLGGWAGGQFSQRRARSGAPQEAVRRRRSIRITRIIRTMRRPTIRRSSVRRAPKTFPRLVNAANQVQTKL